MERVQYHLERSLPQLQLLDEAGVFTKEQLHSITTQRQSHEARLIRRAPQKVDFLRYADFEQNLSDLIVAKAVRMELGRHFTQQNYALHTGHIVSVWERLVRRFKWDVDSWQRYIEWANKRKMRVVVGRLYARALSLHPNKIPLWLSAASHELNNNSSTTAARSLLQRALRQNALPWKPRDAAASAADGLKRKSADGADETGKKLRTGDASTSAPPSTAVSGPLKLKLSARETDLLRLWVEYFRMELVFIERLRRRWIVLGIQWEGDDAQSSEVRSDDPEVSAAAQTLQDEADLDEGAAEENEKVLLSQVPEREEGVEVDTDANGRSARPSEPAAASSCKPNTFTQRAAADIPEAQLSILRGSIPVFLVSNALSTLPPSLHFVFLLALLELFRNFPFADSAGGTISGQQSSKAKATVQTHATRSGEKLRRRLIDTVYGFLSDRERWGWRYYAPVATLVATRTFRDPVEKLLSVEEEMEVEAEAQDELRDGQRLTKASTLRTTFSEDSDALLDLAEWIRMGGGHRSASSSSSTALRLTLHLLEAALVDPVEGESGKTEPSLLSLRLARNGLVPQAVQQVVETMRPLCAAAPLPTSAASLLSSFNAKSDFYTAATLLLNLLSDPTRSSIDEPNLLKYIDAVRTELIAEARKVGHGVESGQMRASMLRRKFGALVGSDDVEAAETGDKRRKKLLKAIKEAEEATAPASKGGFPGNEDLWRLRIELKLALTSLEDDDAEARRQKLSAEWNRGLLACSNSELDSELVDGEEVGDDVSALQGGLWNAYLEWVQGEVEQMIVEGGAKEAKAVKKATKWMHAEYETAIRTTSSLLSRSTVSSVRATSNLATLQAKKQSTHDLVLKRYVALCAELDARRSPSSGTKASSLDRAIDHCLSSSFGSQGFYKFVIDLLTELRSTLAASTDGAETEEETASETTRATVAKLDNRISHLYQRSIDLHSSRLSTSSTRRSSSSSDEAATTGGDLVGMWTEYLSYLVKVKGQEMGAVLEVLENAKRNLKGAFARRGAARTDEDRAAQEIRALERGWEAICQDLAQNGEGGEEEEEEQTDQDETSDDREDA
ncbi:uncharacterized protein PFL1_06477 [Pseudozyma flocculosa PF-1]|uniref:Related to UTP6 - U3 snoRNP protein n=2 Tax=Pseudozyma flocculosa TaxID=84751 RepID=A0A5C3ETQ6_9BASI|nr:uncharacterized protein PFL1_06477 [Pseudozyma flocculosa PF-1]EPQ26024.1 hypothetical protein PFL1_06477 [Pseudozyma flocculosa PF-1]SPO35668.1 related to UTP6 - U3 snoRNP protein [Pseudozyma flocculosa]